MRFILSVLSCGHFVLGVMLASLATVVDTAAALPADAPTLVHIQDGTIQGHAANGTIAFKGIPFAEPPVGALRWRPPQPVTPWVGTLNASELQFDCSQPPLAMGSVSKGISEDCLYLNLWRPVSASDRPLPVMVWIYGGGLTRGAASLYPGDDLARQGMVYVSFNYRLGRLGFFAHPALARETRDGPLGNYGYMDQIAALKWVQRNVGAFGGDPNNVTIAGESAGGGSVLVMLTSPMARGLFNRAILQSPGIPTPRAGALPMSSLDAAERTAVDYARSLGIKDDDNEALAKLRALPTETLYKGTLDYIPALFTGAEIPGLSFCIVDGRLVVESPEMAIRRGHQAMVPVIVGANDADIAASAASSKDELFALFGSLTWQARALYDPRGDASLETLIQAVISDRTMVEPSRNLAELMAKAGQPAFFYRFSYVAEAQRPKLQGATHASEIMYAFDDVSLILRDKASVGDVELAKTMSGYWAAFARSGDPNGDGRPEWPRYDPTTREVLNFTNTGVKFGPDPLKARLDLWRSVWSQGP